MVKLAVHFWDINRAEQLKRKLYGTLDCTAARMIDKRFPNYRWTDIAYYLMGEINEIIGHLKVVKEEFHKTYTLMTYARIHQNLREARNGRLWHALVSDENQAKQKLEEWSLEDVPKLETIEAYKATMEPNITYILE